MRLQVNRGGQVSPASLGPVRSDTGASCEVLCVLREEAPKASHISPQLLGKNTL